MKPYEMAEPRYDLMHEVAVMLAEREMDIKTIIRKMMELTPDEINLLSAIILIVTMVNDKGERHGIDSTKL